MGENGVYRKQFYTKLVNSCHFMFLYLNKCSFFAREDKFFFPTCPPRCNSKACLCLHKVIDFSLTCGFITFGRIMSPLLKDDQRFCQATKSLWKQSDLIC